MRGSDDRERERRLLVQERLHERAGTPLRQLLEMHEHLLLLRHHLRGGGDSVSPLRLRDDPHHLTPAPHCPIKAIRQGRSYKGSAVFGRPLLVEKPYGEIRLKLSRACQSCPAACTVGTG